MRRPRAAVIALAAATVALATACGSGGTTTAGGSAAAGGSSIKVGVVTSVTGPAAVGFTPDAENGVKARLGLANALGGVNGQKITYVVADDQSTPAGDATAVRQLIEQDHVAAILDVSSFFFGGYSVAVQAGIPVFGGGFDGGGEWLIKQDKNLFDVDGSSDWTKVATTMGLIAKKLGITKVGAIGYSGSPSAEEGVNAFVASAVHAGITKGYTSNIAFGSTNVGPAVLGIKGSSTDGVFSLTEPGTALAVATGLSQNGVKMKGVILATGYGGSLLADKAAVAAANGDYFFVIAAPVESGNKAALAMQQALHTYAGLAAGDEPTLNEVQAWLSADALVAALKKAGPNPTSASIVSNFRNATWNAGGLFPVPVNFADYGNNAGALGPGNCSYVIRLMNGKFVPVQGLDPICGSLIPGVTVGPLAVAGASPRGGTGRRPRAGRSPRPGHPLTAYPNSYIF